MNHLHQHQGLLRHFLAVAVDQFDSIVVVGVVADGDHNATVEIIHAGNVGHGRGSRNMQQVGIRPRGCQARDQAVLEHVRTPTSILAYDNASRVGVTIALTQRVIILAQKTSNLVGMVGSQRDSGFTTEAIRSKILSHY